MTYLIKSAQTKIHPDLEKMLDRAQLSKFEKPYNKQVVKTFRQLAKIVDESRADLILDSCCGTGFSTLVLAKKHPEALVIGFDQSAIRLKKAPLELRTQKNAILVRAEAVDLWRLIHEAGWPIKRHFIFYPNPWPKKSHLRRRFHGHPVFPLMVGLSEKLEIRTNWKIYAEEVAAALQYLGGVPKGPETFISQTPISLFEKKYLATQTPLYRISLDRGPDLKVVG